MAFSLLLPLLVAGAEPQVVATGDHAVVEAALSRGVRQRIDAGWSLVDVHTEKDDFIVTLGKADGFERHVLHVDSPESYRIEIPTAPPIEPEEPSAFMIEAVSAPRGGFEITSGCGDYYARPFIVDDEATGEFASALVARQLATSIDVRRVTRESGHVVFTIAKKEGERELLVWLDPKGKVIEAQVRRFAWESGGSHYKRVDQMKRATRNTRVTSIATLRDSSLVLVTPAGRFELDPDASSFDYDDDGEGGCGC
jgi:hypothetical protein